MQKLEIPFEKCLDEDSSGPYTDHQKVTVYVWANTVVIEQEDGVICLSKNQAKYLCYYLHDTVARPPPNFDIEGDDYYEL